MLKSPLNVEDVLEFGRGEVSGDIRILGDESLKISPFVPHPEGIALNPLIGLLSEDSLANQFEQQSQKLGKKVSQAREQLEQAR